MDKVRQTEGEIEDVTSHFAAVVREGSPSPATEHAEEALVSENEASTLSEKANDGLVVQTTYHSEPVKEIEEEPNTEQPQAKTSSTSDEETDGNAPHEDEHQDTSLDDVASNGLDSNDD